MLKFSGPQVRRLDDAVMRQCAMRFCDFLQEQFVDAAALGREQLLDGVLEQLGRAGGHGLQTQRHLLCYVVTAWLLGARFDEVLPAPRLVLDDLEYTADEKIEWLEDWTVELLHRLSPDIVVPTLDAVS